MWGNQQYPSGNPARQSGAAAAVRGTPITNANHPLRFVESILGRRRHWDLEGGKIGRRLISKSQLPLQLKMLFPLPPPAVLKEHHATKTITNCRFESAKVISSLAKALVNNPAQSWRPKSQLTATPPPPKLCLNVQPSAFPTSKPTLFHNTALRTSRPHSRNTIAPPKAMPASDSSGSNPAFARLPPTTFGTF